MNKNKKRILAILTNGGMRMKEEKIRVLMVEPNEYPKETVLNNWTIVKKMDMILNDFSDET